jgi:hypothetical protein
LAGAITPSISKKTNIFTKIVFIEVNLLGRQHTGNRTFLPDDFITSEAPNPSKQLPRIHGNQLLGILLNPLSNFTQSIE